MRAAVWIVGNWRYEDFSAPIAWLQQAARCTTFDHPAIACDTSRAGRLNDEPTAILFAESQPGEICAADAERLLAAWPLAHVAVLFGPWCEGTQRKSRSLPGIVRVGWSRWQSRLARELGLTDSAGPPRPRTTTGTERIEQGNLALETVNRPRGRVAVCTSGLARFQALAEATERLGFAPIWQSVDPASQARAYDLAIYDGWEQVAGENESLVEAGAWTCPKRVLLLSFPRPDDFSHAARLGIETVVAQPVVLGDLVDALERATGRIGR